ncbi:hypothetical protein D9M68_676100 [compost metagenome]
MDQLRVRGLVDKALAHQPAELGFHVGVGRGERLGLQQLARQPGVFGKDRAGQPCDLLRQQ